MRVICRGVVVRVWVLMFMRQRQIKHLKICQPVIAYAIFISACLQMCFEDVWLRQPFHLLLLFCFLLFGCQMGGFLRSDNSLISAKFTQWATSAQVNLLLEA